MELPPSTFRPHATRFKCGSSPIRSKSALFQATRPRFLLLTGMLMLAFWFGIFSTDAARAVSPHGGYGTGYAPDGAQTDLCLSCHDIHQAAGDYALMREATVTETCGTCHVLFGVPTGDVPTWTEPPVDLVDADTGEASVSPSAAYEFTGAARVSGHRLGVSLDANSNASDLIPAGTQTLKVMQSVAYEEGEIYAGQSVLEYGATMGLYCGSCHTPHGSLQGTDTNGNGVDDTPLPVNIYNSSGQLSSQAYFGDQLVVDDSAGTFQDHVPALKLISSNPNHFSTRSLKSENYTDSNGNGKWDVGEPLEDTLIANGLRDSFMTPDDVPLDYNDWCITCHDLQWNDDPWDGQSLHGTDGSNHPPICTGCHGSSGSSAGINDFPHTSDNIKLMKAESDSICTSCHLTGTLP